MRARRALACLAALLVGCLLVALFARPGVLRAQGSITFPLTNAMVDLAAGNTQYGGNIIQAYNGATGAGGTDEWRGSSFSYSGETIEAVALMFTVPACDVTQPFGFTYDVAGWNGFGNAETYVISATSDYSTFHQNDYSHVTGPGGGVSPQTWSFGVAFSNYFGTDSWYIEYDTANGGSPPLPAYVAISNVQISCTAAPTPVPSATPTITPSATPSPTATVVPSATNFGYGGSGGQNICINEATTVASSTYDSWQLTNEPVSGSITPVPSATALTWSGRTSTPAPTVPCISSTMNTTPIAIITPGTCITWDQSNQTAMAPTGVVTPTFAPYNLDGCAQTCTLVLPGVSGANISSSVVGVVLTALGLSTLANTTINIPAIQICFEQEEYTLNFFGIDLMAGITVIIAVLSLISILAMFKYGN